MARNSAWRVPFSILLAHDHFQDREEDKEFLAFAVRVWTDGRTFIERFVSFMPDPTILSL
jgi:hypothetical protein